MRASGCRFIVPDWRVGVATPEELRADHSDQVDAEDVGDHRLRGGLPHADRPTGHVVAVVDAHEHDERGHEQAFDAGKQEVCRGLKLPEQLQIAAGRDLAELHDDGQVRGQEPERHRGHVQERQHQPGAEQPG
jgi:hypothetical protein